MSDKINFKLFKPFGSTLAKATLPLELLKDFKEDLKKIREDKQKQKDHDWSKKLVGHVAEEYLITPEVLLKWKGAFFDPIIASYTNAHYKSSKIQNILINSAWYVISQPGDYNPLHRHTEYIYPNYHLSCVGYLQIPNMISTTNAKLENNFSGQTEFVEGSEGMFCDVSHRVDPQERDWILFPNTLSHIVYPYDTKDDNKERISFSFNATIVFDHEYKPSN
jgi:hypothetical protein